VAILAAHPDTLQPAPMKTTAETWAGILTVVLSLLAALAYRGRGPASPPRWERIVSIAILVLVLSSWLFYMLPRTLVSMADAHITFVHQPIDVADTCKRAKLFRDWSDSGEYDSPRWMYKVAAWSPSTKALAQCRLARHYAELGTAFTCDPTFQEGKEALEQCVDLECTQMIGGFDSDPITLSQYCASLLEQARQKHHTMDQPDGEFINVRVDGHTPYSYSSGDPPALRISKRSITLDTKPVLGITCLRQGKACTPADYNQPDVQLSISAADKAEQNDESLLVVPLRDALKQRLERTRTPAKAGGKETAAAQDPVANAPTPTDSPRIGVTLDGAVPYAMVAELIYTAGIARYPIVDFYLESVEPHAIVVNGNSKIRQRVVTTARPPHEEEEKEEEVEWEEESSDAPADAEDELDSDPDPYLHVTIHHDRLTVRWFQRTNRPSSEHTFDITPVPAPDAADCEVPLRRGCWRTGTQCVCDNLAALYNKLADLKRTILYRKRIDGKMTIKQISAVGIGAKPETPWHRVAQLLASTECYRQMRPASTQVVPFKDLSDYRKSTLKPARPYRPPPNPQCDRLFEFIHFTMVE